MGLLPLLLLAIVALSNAAEVSRIMGVNYGQLGDNLPSPSESINLIKTLKAGRVKIYDANPEILKALSGTHLLVSVMLPNEQISNISSNQSAADEWVRSKILPFYPKTLIRILLVGNEILSDYTNKQLWYTVVPAMRRLKLALKTHNLLNIKVGTPLAMDSLQTTFPPSNASFRPDISETVMRPLLQFLNHTKSFYFADVYPYFVWAASPTTVRLEQALLETSALTYADPGSGLTYTNVLDQQLDALVAAMGRVGYPNVRIAIAETGWPNAGDIDQIGANIYNAATYNRNLARRMAKSPPVGTPARPGRAIPTFVFSLFNENRKPGPGTERHWGLFYPNGTGVYEVDLTGRRPDTGYSPLPEPTNNGPYEGKIWCVASVRKGKNESELGAAVAYACGQGNGTCDAIQRGKECYEPNSLVRHASYAFSSYWQQFRSVGGNCYFGGLAVQTTKDPGYGSCKYPAVQPAEAH